jgi:hypothetical protein
MSSLMLVVHGRLQLSAAVKNKNHPGIPPGMVGSATLAGFSQ